MQKSNGLARGLSNSFVRWFEHFLLTFKGGVSFVDLFCYLCFVSFICVFHAVLSVHCSLVVTCWERAGLLALLYVMFSCVVTFPCVILDQIWYLTVSIPDFCLLLNYIYHELASIKNCLFFRMLSTKRRYSNQHTCYI